MDAADLLLVNLQDLTHAAVLSVGGVGTRVFERQAVLEDPLVGGVEVGDELLRPDDEDDVRRAQA